MCNGKARENGDSLLELKCEGPFILCIYLSCKSSIEPPAGLNYFMGAIEGGGLVERSAHLRGGKRESFSLRGGAYSILLLFQTTRKWYRLSIKNNNNKK